MANLSMFMVKFRRYARITGISIGTALVLFLIVDNIVMPLYTHQGQTTTVPEVVGMTLEEAKAAIEKAGLRPHEFEEKPDKEYPVGTVAFQSPPAQSLVKYGRGVYLTVSGGEVQVQVPLLRGKSIREATFALEHLGLKIGQIVYEPSEELFANTVIRQSADPGKRVHSGASIGLVVSQGSSAETKVVPNVIQKSLSEAQKILTQSGFLVGKVIFQPNPDLLPNTIIDQTPKPGEMLMFGQPVHLTVSQKPEVKQTLEN